MSTKVQPWVVLKTNERANRGALAAVVLMGIFAFASCYFRSFIFPYLPLLPGGDQVGFFISGSRIVAGQMPYRDFFEILPVGTDLIYAALTKIFGFYTWVPEFVMACLAAATAALVTFAAIRVVRGAAAILPALSLLGFLLLDESLNATHHWFCTVAALGAMLLLLDGRTSARVLAAGALAGIATCFTQTTGAMVVLSLAIYLVCARRADQPNRWRSVLLLCATAIIVFLAVNGYFIWQAGVQRRFFCTAIYPVRYFGVPTINNWRVIERDFPSHPSFRRWLSFPFIYAAVPFAYFGFFIVWRRNRPHTPIDSQIDKQIDEWRESQDKLLLTALTGLGMIVAVAPAPSFLRVSSASLPAMILLSWFLDRSGRFGRVASQLTAAVALLLAIGVPIHRQIASHSSLDLPGGVTAFSQSSDAAEYRWLASKLQPEQYFFGMPPMILPFHLLNAAPVGAFDTTDYTRPEEVAQSIRAFRAHPVPLMVLRGDFESPVASPNDHTGPFRVYLRENYIHTKTFPNGDQIWEKTEPHL